MNLSAVRDPVSKKQGLTSEVGFWTPYAHTHTRIVSLCKHKYLCTPLSPCMHIQTHTHILTYTDTYKSNNGRKNQERIIRTKFLVALITLPVTMTKCLTETREERMSLAHYFRDLSLSWEACMTRAGYITLGHLFCLVSCSACTRGKAWLVLISVSLVLWRSQHLKHPLIIYFAGIVRRRK